nr:MAG TPA: hypothetical protein [Caudoviricetes sp.]
MCWSTIETKIQSIGGYTLYFIGYFLSLFCSP